MNFLATYWWAFGLGTALFFVVAIVAQLLNMKRSAGGLLDMGKAILDETSDDPSARANAEQTFVSGGQTAGGFFSRLRGIAILVAVTIIGAIITGIGIIAALMDYWK